ncbi:MAG: hypothetical protein R2754_05905 [Microthrixaceae bacterium]
MSPCPTGEWRLDRPLDLRATLGALRQGHDPTRSLSPSGAHWALWTAGGAATLALRVLKQSLRAAAHGPGADEALEGVPALLGLSDRHRLPSEAPPRLERAARRHVGARLGATGDLAGALFPAVLGQRVTSGEAHRSWAELCRRFGGDAPSHPSLNELVPGHPPLVMPAQASALGRLSAHELHRLGVERARGDLLTNLARRAPSMARLVALPADDTRAKLTSLSGVGPWTASIATRVAQGDPDAVLLGDLHVPSNVAWFLAGEVRADDTRMLELLAPFSGQRARVQQLISWSHVVAPRRAPRYRPQPIARR